MSIHAIAVNAKGLPLNAPIATTRVLTIEQFLAGIQSRAFRFAELGLRNRDDALDAVQDAMMRMLRYGDKPSAEWQALFWKILRTRIIDISRRRAFRFRRRNARLACAWLGRKALCGFRKNLSGRATGGWLHPCRR